ncbi:sensor histidine kinase [Catellatospora sp. TT07R-123]|uniref:sensor histidine kinase n=1 Tax=Catellatospora sp. TT07R-123 TaxID=2733863 RepID=UPI001FD5A2D9|nr:sensor histidine kinase [Catellatospora sp. TT07R-123]
MSTRSPLLRDAALALALALVAFVPPLATHGTRLGELPHRSLDALAVAAALAQSLPLALRRRWPAATLAMVVAGFAVQELRGYATFASLGLLIAIYSAAAHQHRLRRWTAGVATAGYLALSIGLHVAGSANRVADYVVFYLCMAAAWLLGAYVRALRSAEEVRRRVEADAARADERARIARELHDVVAHHVTAMVVQANAAQFLPPHSARESLTAIKETGKKALCDLRDLLGVLDPAREARRDRLPGLTELPLLIEQTRAAGQPVSLIEQGRAPVALGAGRELTAYRVVQEALTNALKYAAGRPTVVHLGYRPSGVDISVSTAPSQGPDSADPVGGRTDRSGHRSGEPIGGSGRGLTGLRERVELFGGSLSAGPDGHGGFTVAAHLPAGEAA